MFSYVVIRNAFIADLTGCLFAIMHRCIMHPEKGLGNMFVAYFAPFLHFGMNISHMRLELSRGFEHSGTLFAGFGIAIGMCMSHMDFQRCLFQKFLVAKLALEHGSFLTFDHFHQFHSLWFFS